jgi:hypothetical protein
VAPPGMRPTFPRGMFRDTKSRTRLIGCVLQCSTKDMFIRGSVVRYVHLPSGAVDTALLEDATRRETEATKNKAK